MWEWRAFDEPGRLALPGPLLPPTTRPRVEEARVDRYIIVRGRDDAGLKVRGEDGPAPRVELKLRFDRDGGAEHWAKVFEQRLPLTAAWAQVVLELLGLGHAPRPIADAEELALLVEAPLVRVEKRIAKAPAPPALELEATTLLIAGRALETVAIEAPTLDLLVRERARHGLSAPATACVRGYPELLLAWAPPS